MHVEIYQADEIKDTWIRCKNCNQAVQFLLRMHPEKVAMKFCPFCGSNYAEQNIDLEAKEKLVRQRAKEALKRAIEAGERLKAVIDARPGKFFPE